MQTEELSYAIITPYSMRKSRTGGIIARLISRTGLDLVAARMFLPSEELVRRYAETIVSETEPAHRATQELIRRYVLKHFTGEKQGQRPRVLCLVFRGGNAAERMRSTVGHISHEETSGETIRDTFGDYITDESGKVTYFEPAVVAAFDPTAIERDLKLWAEFSDIRPGGVIEVFSRTGLYIVGFKVHRMSVAQAEDFYGPVLPVLQEKLGRNKGRDAWEDIVEFMAGARPSDTLPEKRNAPGTEKCIALVYQGEDAVRKIREVLGPTDPAKAPPGSIRKEFGQTIMINAAHASDSIENA